MGYYSDFQITKYNEKDDTFEIITSKELQELEEITGYIFTGPYLERVKWYDVIKDMQKFSKIFPDYKWIVEQDGEDKDDFRKYIFKNGKYKELCAEVRIVFPEENSIEWKK